MESAILQLVGEPQAEYVSFEHYKIVIYVQLGLWIWEYIVTFPWEFSVWTGQRPFRWPTVFFFLARYSVWFAMVPNLMLLHSSWRMNCEGVYIFIVIGTCFEVFFGQAIFTIRALSVWEYDRRVVWSLIVLWVPHVALSFSTVTAAKLAWVPDSLLGGGSCQIYAYDSWRYPVAYALVFVIDLYSVFLVTYKLVQLRHNASSSLLNMLVRDGIVYAAIVAMPTLIAIVVYNVANTSALRSSALTFSCLFHALLACRAFMNLSNLCERLPTSIRMKVSNGAYLDEDTLKRIAFHLGGPLEDKELGLGETVTSSPAMARTTKFGRPDSSGTHDSAAPAFSGPNLAGPPLRHNTQLSMDNHGRPHGAAGGGFAVPGPIVHTLTQSEWTSTDWEPMENLGGNRKESFATESNRSPGYDSRDRKDDYDRY